MNDQTIGICLKPQKGITTLMILGVIETKKNKKKKRKKNKKRKREELKYFF